MIFTRKYILIMYITIIYLSILKIYFILEFKSNIFMIENSEVFYAYSLSQTL